jgi:hypothetical protein
VGVVFLGAVLVRNFAVLAAIAAGACAPSGYMYEVGNFVRPYPTQALCASRRRRDNAAQPLCISYEGFAYAWHNIADNAPGADEMAFQTNMINTKAIAEPSIIVGAFERCPGRYSKDRESKR